jgi:3',5'-cyclic-AMP phosphodiesterase
MIMPRFVWSSDTHLDRMDEREFGGFKAHLLKMKPDGFILAGDIAEADCVANFIKDFRNALSCPVYFVLGNHDYWGSSFDEVHSMIRSLVKEEPDLHWLSESGVIELNSETAIIGHEGWGDAGFGTIGLTGTVPNDFTRIKDLAELKRSHFEVALNKLGDKAADYIRKVLSEAVLKYKKIYLVTHVPPFREASLDRSGRICEDQRIPFRACKAIGDVIYEIMDENPGCRLEVLCGHTHEKCEVQITGNIQVKVLDAGKGIWYPPGTIEI